MDLSKDIEEVVRPGRNESREELIVPEQSSSFAKIAFTFIGLAIVLIVGVFYFSYFYTTLVVTPNKQAVETNFEVQVMMLNKIKQESGELSDIQKMLEEWGTSNPDMLSGEVLEATIEKEEKFPASGEGGEEKPGIASGMITIFNKQNVDQDLIKRTRFKSEGEVIFRIREKVLVPANGELEVEVFADEEGAGGNIGSSRFILPGFSSEIKRTNVYGESYKPMTGGVIKEKVLTQEDINKAKETLEQTIHDELLVKLDEELRTMADQAVDEQKLPTEGEAAPPAGEAGGLVNTYDKILPQAVVYEVVDVLISPEIGTKTEELTLKMGVKASAVLFSEENLLFLAKLKIEDKIDDGRELETIDDESLNYSIKRYEEDLGIAVLDVSLSGEGYITSEDLLGNFNLKSLEAEDIEAYLEAHPEIANIEIKEAPIWMRKLPILKDRVRVKVELPE